MMKSQTIFERSDVATVNAVCHRCGTGFSKRKGNFPVSYSMMNKGTGYLCVCKRCLDDMFQSYFDECGDLALAARHICRKLDLYWNEELFNKIAEKSTRSNVITAYTVRLSNPKYVGMSYDDTLRELGMPDGFDDDVSAVKPPMSSDGVSKRQDEPVDDGEDDIDVPEEVMAFWGSGCTKSMCNELQQRFDYWVGKLGGSNVVDNDIGTQMLLKQICSLEIDINRDRAIGKPVDKNMNVLNTLLGSAKLKPVQKDDGDSSLESTPFGVWIRLWENQKPIPKPDPELEDVDGIVKYITVWFFGHVCKMLGIKNHYCKLYEDEIAKRRVDAPQYDDEDDDTFLSDILGEVGGDDDDEM